MLNTCASKGGRLTPALVGWKKQPKRQQDLDPPPKKGILAFQHENAPQKNQKQESAPLNWANTCWPVQAVADIIDLKIRHKTAD